MDLAEFAPWQALLIGGRRGSRVGDVRGRIARRLCERLGPPSAADIVARILAESDCRVAVDLGCGVHSPLSQAGPELYKVGIDVDPVSVEQARSMGLHDAYIVADIQAWSADRLRAELMKCTGGRPVDLVVAFSVVEHLNKADGWRLLEKCESITSKFVVVETPNGYVPQGPEFGNPYQRHLSGWFPWDFEGLGYSVYGTAGTRLIRGYMGIPRLRIPGIVLMDALIVSRLLMIPFRPKYAFNLLAVKDVRGVPARYPAREDWTG